MLGNEYIDTINMKVVFSPLLHLSKHNSKLSEDTEKFAQSAASDDDALQ